MAGLEQIFLSNCIIYDNTNAGVNRSSFTRAISYQHNKIAANGVDLAGTRINAAPGQR